MTMPPLGPRDDARLHHPDQQGSASDAGRHHTDQPAWLRRAYTFVFVLFTCVLIAAFAARGLGAQRGDTGAAIAVFALGTLAAVIITWFVTRRR
ncbi:hypothetical protein HDA30_001383 [Micrococcus cohnii]|uniref:Uncharacterized protein n=1 Tax=Micrococcus cohnii TaxID=993416 RepID=A0A7W7GPH2_9MICC|nr:hypothetical protein [Micrococcus cohnii]MBB4735875.1 hypothetical protein [Micrococcus cohnii]